MLTDNDDSVGDNDGINDNDMILTRMDLEMILNKTETKKLNHRQ